MVWIIISLQRVQSVFVIHGGSSVSLPDVDEVLYLFVMPITCSVGINNLDGAPVHFYQKRD